MLHLMLNHAFGVALVEPALKQVACEFLADDGFGAFAGGFVSVLEHLLTLVFPRFRLCVGMVAALKLYAFFRALEDLHCCFGDYLTRCDDSAHSVASLTIC